MQCVPADQRETHTWWGGQACCRHKTGSTSSVRPLRRTPRHWPKSSGSNCHIAILLGNETPDFNADLVHHHPSRSTEHWHNFVVTYKHLMCSKRTVAVSISVVLFAVSSWTNLCEISCSLSGPHSAPLLNGASSAKGGLGSRTHTSHSHCDHVIPQKPGATPNSLENTSRCSNAACVQVAVLSSPVKGRGGFRLDSRSRVLPTVLSHPVGTHHPSFQNLRCEAARRKAPLPETCSVSLRI